MFENITTQLWQLVAFVHLVLLQFINQTSQNFALIIYSKVVQLVHLVECRTCKLRGCDFDYK